MSGGMQSDCPGLPETRVLYEVPFANLGGTERHALDLIAALRGKVSPFVLAPEGEALALFRAAGVSYRVISPLALSPARALRSLAEHGRVFREVAGQAGFSLVHVHAGIEYAVAAKLAQPAVPLVFTVHGYPDVASYVVSGFLANRLADEVICVSEWERRAALGHGFRRDKLTVIHNGIARPRNHPNAGGDFRRRWGVPDSAVVVGTVSRLERPKGLDYLVRAFSRLSAARPDAVLLVVGWGRARPKLEQLAQDLGVRGSVVFTGANPDPAAAIAAMDVFVLPSLREALGIAILEAMARAKPVVATTVGGIPEAVDHGRTGLLVPPKDEMALAAALIELARNPAKRREYGERGRARFEAGFTAELMARRTLEVYRRVLPAASATEPPAAVVPSSPSR